MIYLSPLEEASAVRRIFEERGISFNGQPGCVTAVCGEKILGLSLYGVENGQMTVYCIEPIGDIPLADGILRSTLHVAAERGIMRAVYGSELSEAFLETVGFIKDKDEKLLDIDKLFTACHGCGEK